MKNLSIINTTLAVVTEMPNTPLMNQFNHIADELSCRHFNGTVVFDLAVSQGLTGRFVKAMFDGVSIKRNSLKKIEDSKVPLQILESQNMFFFKNSNLLKSSMLTSKEIREITSA